MITDIKIHQITEKENPKYKGMFSIYISSTETISALLYAIIAPIQIAIKDMQKQVTIWEHQLPNCDTPSLLAYQTERIRDLKICISMIEKMDQ